MSITQSINGNEEKPLNMILDEIPRSRIAIICDHDGNVLWNSIPNNTFSYLTADETMESLKRSLESWKNVMSHHPRLGRANMQLLHMRKSRELRTYSK
ncbi:hypothetical protein [Nitrosopumilus ureiphilus]|uniref:Uncharacterized protein n=1 Tax=Nitrosopumilus ureiphilus TaxID=1470067 RepID=A0A7D5RG50_9ARCH|nr:hypothetical protein [Nitrosopumilus ureiphilus]QLH06325.1 hypothetical protein C5F50_03970 [Nitrosopumilus ureiphilus]